MKTYGYHSKSGIPWNATYAVVAKDKEHALELLQSTFSELGINETIHPSDLRQINTEEIGVQVI